MKRADIEPGGVYSQVSFRDSRQGWPVLILSTISYQRHHRTGKFESDGTARLRNGDYRTNAVGLIAVSLGFSMNEGEDVLEFRAKVDQVRELSTVEVGAASISSYEWLGGADQLGVFSPEGERLGSYKLITNLAMLAGDYVALTLAERRADAERKRYASEAEQARVANLARYREQAERLEALGITGYHAADWESKSRFDGLKFDELDTLLTMAEAYKLEIGG